MKVLLTKPVAHVGLPGDVCEVKDGYARNYLIPQGFAVLQHDPRARELMAGLAAARADAESSKAKAEAAVKEWEGKTVTLSAKANPDGTLFGAISNKEVAKALGVDASGVHFDTMKIAGEYEAVVDLGFGVSVPVTVIVKAEKKR